MTITKANPLSSFHRKGRLPLRYDVLVSSSRVPMTGPNNVPRPPSATHISNSVPKTKPAYSGATTICTQAKRKPAQEAIAAHAIISRILVRDTLMPRYSQRCSLSRIASRMRPPSLRRKTQAPAVTTTRKTPAMRNQASSEMSKVSNPDSPLLDPVKLPPE